MGPARYNWHNNDCVAITRLCELGKPACVCLWACGTLGVNTHFVFQEAVMLSFHLSLFNFPLQLPNFFLETKI